MIPRAAALAILLAVVCFVLSELGFRSKRAFGALAIMAIMLVCTEAISEIVPKISAFPDVEGVTDTARTALKVVFSGYVFGIASDVASELGESGIANAVTLGGRLEIVLIVLPYLSEVLSLAVNQI